MCHSFVFVFTCVFVTFYVPAITICHRTLCDCPGKSARSTTSKGATVRPQVSCPLLCKVSSFRLGRISAYAKNFRSCASVFIGARCDSSLPWKSLWNSSKPLTLRHIWQLSPTIRRYIPVAAPNAEISVEVMLIRNRIITSLVQDVRWINENW